MNPSLGSAAMRAGTAVVPASVIAEIPFLYASERITVMLDGIRKSDPNGLPCSKEESVCRECRIEIDELRERATRGVARG